MLETACTSEPALLEEDVAIAADSRNVDIRATLSTLRCIHVARTEAQKSRTRA